MPPQPPPKAVITKRVDITHDLWIIWLKPEVPFTFKPGQYCTIGVNGLERPYSIVSSPHEAEIELFIELVPPPAGQLTPILYEMREGAQVTIRPRAKGLFSLNETYPHHLMMATVTGVAPYMSMLRRYLHEGKSGHRFYVLQGGSYADELTYDVELHQMASAHPNLITYVPTISRPNEERNRGWKGETGRVNTLLEKYVEKLGLKLETTLIYACGHPQMIEDVKLRGAALGFPVQEERFWKED